ncbi:MAG: nuclear transport factor 2 family protein [Acidobacteriota bacterium]|nr:nuclear transport factor 2 family protein [Acidobacteriota bacterium]
MPLRFVFLLPLMMIAIPFPAAPRTPREAVRKVLDDQVSAWNRGDIDAFMQGYDDSPATTFIGKSVVKGYAGVRENYHRRYGSAAAMGTLDFSAIEVKPLDARFALVTGKFHLKRTDAGGGDASGIFSLVFEHKAAGWKIILDHTS